MKLTDETWRASDGASILADEIDGDSRVVARAGSAAEARMISCAPEALRMLLKFEWLPDSDAGYVCRSCRATDTYGRRHAADCSWIILMKKAGLR